MRSRFSRLPLLTKILLSTSVAITVLFAITGRSCCGISAKTMSDSLEEEVRNSFQAYTSLLKSRGRAALLGEPHHGHACPKSGWRSAPATAPRSRTPRASCGRKISPSNAVFLVTDPRQSDRLAGRRRRRLRCERQLDVVQRGRRAISRAGHRASLCKTASCTTSR